MEIPGTRFSSLEQRMRARGSMKGVQYKSYSTTRGQPGGPASKLDHSLSGKISPFLLSSWGLANAISEHPGLGQYLLWHPMKQEVPSFPLPHTNHSQELPFSVKWGKTRSLKYTLTHHTNALRPFPGVSIRGDGSRPSAGINQCM